MERRFSSFSSSLFLVYFFSFPPFSLCPSLTAFLSVPFILPLIPVSPFPKAFLLSLCWFPFILSLLSSYLLTRSFSNFSDLDILPLELDKSSLILDLRKVLKIQNYVRISFVNIKIPRQLYLESPEWRRGRREPELRGRWRTSSLVKDSVGHCTEEWGVWVLSQLYIQHPSIQVLKVLRRLRQPGPLSLVELCSNWLRSWCC